MQLGLSKQMMHKNDKILENFDIYKEMFSDNNVRVYRATCKNTKEDVVLRVYKDCVDIKSILNVIDSNEINSLDIILRNRSIKSINNTLYVVQECKDYVPINVLLANEGTTSDKNTLSPQNSLFYLLLFEMLNIVKNNEFIGKIIELLEAEYIWIDANFNIKICWCSLVMSKQNYFNNSIYNLNVNTEKGIFNLINLNSKHIKKRLYSNFFNSDDNLNYSSKFEKLKKVGNYNRKDENQTFKEECSQTQCMKNYNHGKQSSFMNNNYNIASWGSHSREDSTLESYDKEGLRKSGNKKVCLQYKNRNEEEIKVYLDWINLKLFLYKVLFKEKNVNLNLSEFYSQKVLENINSTTEEENTLKMYLKQENVEFERLFSLLDCIIKNLSDDKKNILRAMIYDELNKNKKSPRNSPSPRIPTIKTLDVEGDTLNIIENIFTEKGFDMSDYSTKVYKKGRFHIYEAVPTKKDVMTRGKSINNLLRVIDIQNKQINMIYEIVKNKGKVEDLIDDQLKTLFIEAGNLLDEIDK